MPRKVDKLTAHDKMWSLYVNEVDKLEFLKALAETGKQRCASAAVRALMYLYNIDIETKEKVNKIIDDFIVYKGDGKPSKL